MTDSAHDSHPTSRPRGLWSVISNSASSAPVEAVSEIETEAEVETPAVESSVAAPRGLFAIMKRAEVPDAIVPASEELVDHDRVEINNGDVIDTDGDSIDIPPQSADAIRPTDTTEPISDCEYYDHILPLEDRGRELSVSLRKSAAKRLRQSSITLLCGLASLITSALSMLPEVWMSIPASVLGFFAIILGYLTLTGTRLRNLSGFTKLAAQSGMLLGTLGIFLGPLVFAGLGRDLRESSGNQQTRKHLLAIGAGLNQFYEQHGAYPVGGTFVREGSGTYRGQHGWMTFLLPHIGMQPLFTQIDQTKPFDAPENLKAMGHDVEVYYATGGDRTKIGQGYAVSHFSGVGGDIDDETGLSHAGIFTRDTAITQADVTDGLSNTMIVGEVAGNFAPWGDPENWRTIGRGLNRDVNGFGSSTSNGAMFLFGDGSVKMLSNKTDPRLLKQLSTRDGSEQRP